MKKSQLEIMAKKGNARAIKALDDYKKIIGKKKKNPAIKQKDSSDLFYDVIKQTNLPEPLYGKNELRFHPTRRFKFDFAWPDYLVALEIEGGVYTHRRGMFIDKNGVERQIQSRHLTPKGFEEDAVKYGEAGVLFWTVLRFTTKQCKNGVAIDILTRTLKSRGFGLKNKERFADIVKAFANKH